MIAVAGTYQNGHLTLDKEYSSERPIKVIVTFLEDIEPMPVKRLTLDDFSYAKSQSELAHYNGLISFSDEVVEERRKEL